MSSAASHQAASHASSTSTPATTVPPEDKARWVQAMFNRIAKRYDYLNDAISFGMHRGWKRAACRALQLQPGDSVLDVCTGTGDLIQYLLPQVGPSGRVVGVDFSESMLEVARQRFAHQSQVVQLLQGDALQLPLDSNAMDGAVVSFGLRNVVDVAQAIAEMTRVVRPGGWVVNLDTCPDPAFPLFGWYFRHVMPCFGQLFGRDRQAYQYLFESTQTFLSPEALCQSFEQAGLRAVSARRLALGSVALIAGQKI
ncbi:MAG: bifunctional demethylmenaquinone methyltransferase/2-methoxy-6-polyprenyl-1,4-benzoquinol methylase UbiE [Candidatus Melainabacteria bacterium]|nr:bifunctional demethylmenaquinone methyltransferase/2-methoxy-6-polyprenyl-1,4-benzoquinol methylase UbiE [Candidatus Melainabacteria bacterium]